MAEHTVIKPSDDQQDGYKSIMNYFKAKRSIYKRTFTAGDLLGVILSMPEKELEKLVDNYMLASLRESKISEMLVKASDETKAEIEALLAREAAKQG